MKIAISKGMFAEVDPEDFERTSQFKWYALHRWNSWHAAHTTKKDGRKTTIYMHRLVIAAPPGMQVDHANGNGLDNRKENLRICTKRQNAQNRRQLRGAKSSGFHGVSLCSKTKRWRVQICAGELDRRGYAKPVWIGYFDDEIEAARACDAAARSYFGVFAATNFPTNNNGVANDIGTQSAQNV